MPEVQCNFYKKCLSQVCGHRKPHRAISLGEDSTCGNFPTTCPYTTLKRVYCKEIPAPAPG
jgi:hypothetical protein